MAKTTKLKKKYGSQAPRFSEEDAQVIGGYLDKCFPDGTENVTEDEIITEVFRHLKRRNCEHKPRT